MSLSRFLPAIFCLSLLVLAACDSNDPPPLIFNADPNQVATVNQVESELGEKSVTYANEYKVFSSNKPIADLCGPEFTASLEKVGSELSTVGAEMAPREGLYRGEALDFFRKVKNMLSSIFAIQKELKAFCGKEDKFISNCLEAEKRNYDPIAFFINRNIGGHETVHPVLLTNPKSKFALVGKLESSDDFRVFNMELSQTSTINTSESLTKFTSEPELFDILACFEFASTGSVAAQVLYKSVKGAAAAAEEYCDERHESLGDFCFPRVDGDQGNGSNSTSNDSSPVDKYVDQARYLQGLKDLAEVTYSISEAMWDNHSQLKKYINLEKHSKDDTFDFLSLDLNAIQKNLKAKILQNLSTLSKNTKELNKILDRYPELLDRVVFEPLVVPSGFVASDLVSNRLFSLSKSNEKDFKPLHTIYRNVVEFDDRFSKETVHNSETANFSRFEQHFAIKEKIFKDTNKAIAEVYEQIRIGTEAFEILGDKDAWETVLERILAL